MALLAKRMLNGEPKLVNNTLVIDLTQDSDREGSPLSKRQKSYDDEEARPDEKVPYASSSAISPGTPERPPVAPARVGVSKNRLEDGSNEHVFIPKKSPFKQRPSWSARNRISPPIAQPSFKSKSSSRRHSLHKAASTTSERSSSSPRATSTTNFKSSTSRLPSEARNLNESSHLKENFGPDFRVEKPGLVYSPALQSSGTALESDFRIPVRSKSPNTEEQIPTSQLSQRRQTSGQSSPPSSTPKQSKWTPKTPNPRIAVVIDNSHRKSQVSPTSEDLLRSFSQALPSTRQSGNLVSVDTTQARETRGSLLVEVKKDTSVTRTRASSVEAVFDVNETKGDESRLRNVAPRKAKKIDRESVKLDRCITFDTPSEFFDPKNLVHPREQARAILDAKFNSSLSPSLTFVNDLNDRQLNGKFQFISSYVKRDGIQTVRRALNLGCNCVDSCRVDTCSCFLQGENGDVGDIFQTGKIVPYQRVPLSSEAGGGYMTVLRDNYIESETSELKTEIVECNENCACDSRCWNRVVQKGRTVPLEIFMTQKCGFGLRSPHKIIKGQFIDLYLGEVITGAALESRELANEDGAPSYVYSLDWFHQGKDIYYVDSLNFGTPTRFINHSCNPNCRTFTVMLNRADERVYGLAVFALCDIPAMTELRIDYNPQEAGRTYSVPRPEDDDEDVVLCHCGERNCRVRLWPGPRRKRGKGWART